MPHHSVSCNDVNYTDFETLLKFFRDAKPTFIIHADGYTDKPNVDACETAWADTLNGNTLFPLSVAHAYSAAGIPWGYVSSGCIYTGVKVVENGTVRVEKDLTQRGLARVGGDQPIGIQGFDERDEPRLTNWIIPETISAKSSGMPKFTTTLIRFHIAGTLCAPLWICGPGAMRSL